ncbi:homoprotocatechuate degradation operon regulator, HpaR [Luminiphilus syltensis NOR5-1B]|uniref:Homoprotocatechuate degradation operon regulator, HpaR n=1 Tax=Luminiphilus syltensis NOR5-1B TaxID=565045 RepID=B8KT95_9GAMM|nr:homoprotocatechuate degradation operon regulator HpaR [Luminiphilus syltensis]EED35648.1 homoprotocatechuate degradation operon regulator, HpaR [Luminiphilus syltensis NOR5-1B]
MGSKQSHEAALSDLRRFDQSLPMRLLKAHEAVLRAFIPHLRAHDLSTQQWRVMRALGETKTLDISELADSCSLLRPSVSRILQNLESRGITRRRVCSDDSRRSLVSITPKGRKLLAQLAPESEARYDYIESCFGGRQLTLLYRLLDELVGSLNEPPPEFGELPGEKSGRALR